MAPSQHIRTQRVRTQIRTALGNRRRTAPVVLLLGASLLVSACEPKQSDTAAVVDGNVISEKELQTVSRQLDVLTEGSQPLPPGSVLSGLILSPYVFAEGNRQRKSISDEQVLQVIGKIPNPTAATANFVKMDLLLQEFDEASRDRVGQSLGKARIVVNPRYGTYLPRQGLLQASPNWIKPAATPAAK